MKIFLVFLLVSSSEQLSCIRRSDFQFSTNPFDAEEFQKDLKSLQPFNAQTEVCRVEVAFNYDQQYLEVAFNPARPTGGSNQAEQPRFVTTFSLDPLASRSESVLVYTCSRKKACDRDFVVHLSSWQLDHNYSQLQIKLADLLIKKSNLPLLCVIKSTEQKLGKCQSGMCRTVVTRLNNISSNYHGECVGTLSASTNVKITSISDYQTFVFKHDVIYTCMYSECNNATTVHEVLDAILRLYDVSKMFNNENIENQTLFSTTKPTTSPSITKPTTSRSNINQRTTSFSNQTRSTTAKEIMSLGITTMPIQTITSNNIDKATKAPKNAAMLKFQKAPITVKIVLFVVLICFNP